VEAQLQQITLLSYELNNNPILKALARTKSFSPEQRISVHRFLSQSAALLAQYPIVYDFYIYFSANDTILSSTGTYSGLWYYKRQYQQKRPHLSGMEGAAYRQYGRPLTFRATAALYRPATQGKYVLCARSLLNGGGSSAATIVIKVPKGCDPRQVPFLQLQCGRRSKPLFRYGRADCIGRKQYLCSL
jgi:hypothetical protein